MIINVIAMINNTVKIKPTTRGFGKPARSFPLVSDEEKILLVKSTTLDFDIAFS